MPHDQNIDAATQIQGFLTAVNDQLSSGQVLLDCTIAGDQVTTAALAGIDYRVTGRNSLRFVMNAESKRIESPDRSVYAGQSYDPIQLWLANTLRSRVYYFRAERMNIGESATAYTATLEPDASNLPRVLNWLRNEDPPRFERYQQLVTTVFPQLQLITIPQTGSNTHQIRLWASGPGADRPDLAIPLAESGTGIGQVLAILYVAVTAYESQVIVIDEPQSFLHPGAIRKLFEILRQQFPQHQYIVTTHSPTVITAADPGVLLRVRKVGAESSIEVLDSGQAQELRDTLLEVGARLADVFGADNILWVEGPTEEECFPVIATGVAELSLQGTKMVAVLHTGDFESKHSQTIVNIYERLSRGGGLLPPAIGFVFDREGRNEKERGNLMHLGNVFLLERRMLENYLLNPRAIATVLNSEDNGRDTAVTSEQVAAWLADNLREAKYYDRHAVKASALKDYSEDLILRDVHGASLLEDLFIHFTDNRVNYAKVHHGLMLTTWLVGNEPGEIEEVANLLKRALQPG